MNCVRTGAKDHAALLLSCYTREATKNAGVCKPILWLVSCCLLLSMKLLLLSLCCSMRTVQPFLTHSYVIL